MNCHTDEDRYLMCRPWTVKHHAGQQSRCGGVLKINTPRRCLLASMRAKRFPRSWQTKLDKTVLQLVVRFGRSTMGIAGRTGVVSEPV